MNIKKKLKKEKSVKKNTIWFSVIIMIIMTYVVFALYYSGYFKGGEIFFSFLYIVVVDGLLILNILRIISNDKFEFYLSNDNEKIKIKDGLLSSPFSINLDWIYYIDAAPKANADDIEVLIVSKKGKRNKRFLPFDDNLVKAKPYYKNTYKYIMENKPCKDLYYYIVRKSGAKKYYYLYLIYKNAYDANFSDRALDYIKDFSEEYNL
ncbi:MAG TPA: hypothetical protein DEF85_02710 [Clostridiaceae bacterium]|nr:hypothetical protein [Clostridiaceae bacterium]HBF76909.1 hypothetical protein [Clostridiaceae bacterium]HBG39387.1 hypothetical protein [Clostridiaceae bacterium]HBN27447.1 hypothetical protein [Clostridiaceae bacterium]HBX47788.1 hypothetical protein [Clostridiaceae bacterium]